MTSSVIIESLSTYILVFCRMGGMIFFNPLLSRKNIPSQVKTALVMGITLLITPSLSATAPSEFTDFVFIWTMIKELFVGFAFGTVFQFFYYMLFAAGDIVDMGFGLSMAKAFDPGANIQVSMSGNIFQILFIMYFFVNNCHLILIKLMVSSYDLVNLGAVTFGSSVGSFMMTLFSSVFTLSIQLALPFIAASFILEISMGLLMKLIPQINVFSIHFQFKVVFGILLLFLFAEPTASFINKYINTMFMSMQELLGVI
ncbi:flagellar biosynthetic protein FliR [Scatolibacter rhodanostii]|uniref:flagellar biosynthetic protein FliR n=1 Tax=Scatolibacter rhodanostii TaxID=2014781 RepID=UPI000C06AAC1|nr:flagellar biosynthetic protein FliR [Scatolibacter rhodanostii]